GVEIARSEKLASGKIPLITLRSDVDYATVEAQTLQGKIGVKVWIYHGEVFGRKDKLATAQAEAADSKKGGKSTRAPRA
ncbi:MAG TPA: 30S ribosomal protein S3, partial [Candidatus Kapabacteria bacterium]|nr:30S ribosomal protein S3 [Candidatus Kapabacteria bacterium]